MIETSIAQGQENLARLKNEYIKDHTLLPGEWYGGTVGIALLLETPNRRLIRSVFASAQTFMCLTRFRSQRAANWLLKLELELTRFRGLFTAWAGHVSS